MVSIRFVLSILFVLLLSLHENNVLSASFQSSSRERHHPRGKIYDPFIISSFPLITKNNNFYKEDSNKNVISAISCLQNSRRDTYTPLLLAKKTETDLDSSIDDITAEAEEAILIAKAAIDATTKNDKQKKVDKASPPPNIPPVVQKSLQRNNPVPPNKDPPVDPRIQSEAIAAAIGSLPIGAALGFYAGVKLPELSVDDSILPIGFAFLTSIVAYSASSQPNGPLGAFTRTLIGKPTKAFSDFITNTIQEKITKTGKSIAAIPSNIVDAAQKQVTKTTNDIIAIPQKITNAAIRKVEETKVATLQKLEITKDNIIQFPKRISDAAIDAVEELGEEIMATPGRVVSMAKDAVEKSVDNSEKLIIQTVDDTKNKISQIPQRISNAAVDAAEEIASEIKATPSRVASKAKESIDKTLVSSEKMILKTVDDTASAIYQVVDDVIQIPTKKVEELTSFLDQNRGGTINIPKPEIPKPPQLPPPPPPIVQTAAATADVVKVSSSPSIPIQKLSDVSTEIKRQRDEITKALETATGTIRIPKPPNSNPKQLVVTNTKEKEQLMIDVARVAEQERKKKEVEDNKIKAKQMEIKLKEQHRILELQEQKVAAASQQEKQKVVQAQQENQRKEIEERQRKEAGDKKKEMVGDLKVKENEAKEKEQRRLREEQAKKLQQQQVEGDKAKKELENKKAVQAQQERQKKEAEDKKKKTLEDIKAKENQVKEKEQRRLQEEVARSQSKALAEAKKRKQLEDAEKAKAKEILLKRQRAEAEEKAKMNGAAVLAAAFKQRETLRVQQEKEFQRQKVIEEKAKVVAEQQKQRQKELSIRAAEQKKKQDENNKRIENERRQREEESRKKKLELEGKKKELELQKQAIARKKRDELEATFSSTTTAVKSSPSISLFPRPSLKVNPTLSIKKSNPTLSIKKTIAPRGVGTIISWRKRLDGGIAGRIYGSSNFEEGERIETSKIVSGIIQNGNVVKTSSGTQYFLSNTVPVKSSKDESPLKSLMSALPGATITLTKQKNDQNVAKNALLKKVTETKPRPTFALFRPNISPDTTSTSNNKKVIVSPPRGVPTLKRWKKNRDGSITGFIYNSSNFGAGEKVTTSTISQGNLKSGETVRTGSGSRYFLD